MGWVLLTSLAALALPISGMRAAVYTSRSWDLRFHLDKVAVMNTSVPQPGFSEVLVRVHASNVNPVDHKIVQMAGLLWSYPHRLGMDLSGVVVSRGPGCSNRIKVGDEVWGEAGALLEVPFTGGTFAEYAVVAEHILGVKPKALSMLEAGAMPMVALTGYEALNWAAKDGAFAPDTTVLVLGGSGGTGHMGIQLAKAMGAAKVITTCSSRHMDFVKGLGADHVIDYHSENYWEVLARKSVDVVYDCVGQRGTGNRALKVLKRHGKFVSLLRAARPSVFASIWRHDVSQHYPLCIGACAGFSRIDKIAALAEQGKLRVHIDTTYSLEDIGKAFYQSLVGHATGKIALQMAPPNETAVAVPSEAVVLV